MLLKCEFLHVWFLLHKVKCDIKTKPESRQWYLQDTYTGERLHISSPVQAFILPFFGNYSSSNTFVTFGLSLTKHWAFPMFIWQSRSELFSDNAYFKHQNAKVKEKETKRKLFFGTILMRKRCSNINSWKIMFFKFIKHRRSCTWPGVYVSMWRTIILSLILLILSDSSCWYMIINIFLNRFLFKYFLTCWLHCCVKSAPFFVLVFFLVFSFFYPFVYSKYRPTSDKVCFDSLRLGLHLCGWLRVRDSR